MDARQAHRREPAAAVEQVLVERRSRRCMWIQGSSGRSSHRCDFDAGPISLTSAKVREPPFKKMNARWFDQALVALGRR